ncbi:MAG: four helix bundle protein [Candidatus Omnitrophota bacterium]
MDTAVWTETYGSNKSGYRLQATSCRLQASRFGFCEGLEVQSYKDLEVYRLSHRLAIKIHKMTLENLPKFEMYEEGTQIRRSSKSVSATIVEGFGRKQYQQEYIRYITYAIASVDETKEHLELLFQTDSLKQKDLFQFLSSEYEKLGKMLYCFRETIRRNL